MYPPTLTLFHITLLFTAVSSGLWEGGGDTVGSLVLWSRSEDHPNVVAFLQQARCAFDPFQPFCLYGSL